MTGDFSRLRFDRAKQYTSVIAQQGRVQLDSDANEQRAIDEYLRSIGLIDIIGSGAPIHAPGFEMTVSADGRSIAIGSGRFYVDGLLCEAGTAFDYMQQPYFLRPTPAASGLLTGLRRSATARLHVWLEAWQRLVTPIDDPGIKDVALGEADTADRLQTVWRVVAEAATASGTTRSCCDDMRLPVRRVPPGLMTVGVQDASGQGNCLPAPHAGYRGLENQLYRVEVHRGGDITQATFKWSRDNGSVASAITHVSGSVVTVDSLGPDANLGFLPGQWVEISDDNDLFGQTPNQPGRLFQIANLGPSPLDITLTQPTPAVGAHAKLRRWDQTGNEATANGLPIHPSGQNVLENGIFVQFSAERPFAAGDHWLIAARTATGLPEWPPSDSNGAAFQPAKNITVHRAPLACIRFDANARAFTVEQCRATFAPLTELTPPVIPPALHVTQISWPNDDILSLDQLLVQGLTVTLDTPPAPTIDAATFAVVLELPFGVSEFTPSRSIGLERLMLALDGGVTVTANDNTVAWALGAGAVPFLSQMADGLAGLADRGSFIRARVTLKGRAIRGANPAAPIYLDGQSFGVPGLRSDGDSRTDLALPSGDNEKASDFESWFYLAPVQRIADVAISPAAVAFVVVRSPIIPRPILKLVDNTSGQPNPNSPAVVPLLALSLHYNALVDTTITLSVAGGTAGTVTAPTAVTIAKGAKTPAEPVPLTVRNPGPGAPQTITVTATLTLPSGRPASASAQIVVTGVTPPAGTGGPFFPGGPILSPGTGPVLGSPNVTPGPTVPGG